MKTAMNKIAMLVKGKLPNFKLKLSMLLVIIVFIGSTQGMKWRFREQHSFKVRYNESAALRAKYPDKIPLIIKTAPKSTIQDIDRHKLLVPRHLTLPQFIYIIRQRISLPPTSPMYFFANDAALPTTSSTMDVIYEEYKYKDGFLYITYSGEE
ncbi:unnamed protein product [Owenia fusiformis]|uniref:Uncharacterized protein n=1 Tax=Owenia fusiformis TaxID=6347 RepID=A0A8J1TV33_OWEFU|nr:unnamed protein product [Owenia fusiformis]